ncbi:MULTISPECIES: ABC transporter substrate-binding protein [unclassified Kitasatospora]|uniref:peptide ABC transporter substrate-binding protein n=1 Tax=unclassified Kitasatospora TaxID=2633591 RepID=UPI00070F9332|nr:MULTISPECIES: ABC transporter substrate-binding protein [unclassified Kitasatospora]KQV23884.1 peptide ABC transporter substrate-binding protein [Kitasatospora sp. Root107]KRB67404.1 peptide ABC transporter substrate-binding protein [Kitasatospora sp. Root187]
MPAATRTRWAVIGATSVALVATGCGSSGDGGGSSDAGKTFSYQSSEPQNPLQPANANEVGGGRIIQNLFKGLVDYDPANGQLRNQVADKIDSSDAQTFNVTLKSGWTFHDGTPVKAKNFVDAWNWAATTTNNQINSSWFGDIQGYADVHPKSGAPAKTTMSGLTVVDDTHFTIKLTSKVSYFPYKLGYIAFSPLPDSFFADPTAAGQKPVGNGPYQFVSWDHNSQVVTKTFANYQGVDKPKNGGVVFKMYTTSEAAYADLQSNNLDVMDQVPPSALANYKNDLGDRAIDSPQGAIQNIGFTLYQPEWAGANKAKVRQGLSMAIDRSTITKTVLQGSRMPASAWVAEGVEGYKAGTCGDFCTFNADKAKQLITEGGGVPGNKLLITYNADGGHKEWVDAVCNSIRQSTGVDCVGDPKTDFKTSRAAITGHTINGAFRTGWVQDYPLNANFLADVYKTGAASNDFGYSSPQFDQLANTADQADSITASATGYQSAEAVLAQDFPAIPLWYYRTNSGYSTKVQNVEFDSFGNPAWTQVEVKG